MKQLRLYIEKLEKDNVIIHFWFFSINNNNNNNVENKIKIMNKVQYEIPNICG